MTAVHPGHANISFVCRTLIKAGPIRGTLIFVPFRPCSEILLNKRSKGVMVKIHFPHQYCTPPLESGPIIDSTAAQEIEYGSVCIVFIIYCLKIAACGLFKNGG